MTHTNLQHRRTHNLLLISKLLSQQSQTSPFTLVLDTLEQPARPLLKEYVRRAILAKTVTTVFLAFESFTKPAGVDHFVPCYGIGEGSGWQRIATDVARVSARSGGTSMYLRPCPWNVGSLIALCTELLIIIDSLTVLGALSLNAASKLNLTAFLSSLLQPQMAPAEGDQLGQALQTSLVAVYHTDVPLPSPAVSSGVSSNTYNPSPLSLLTYLATTVITVHSLAILLAEKAAQAKSLAAPSFGLAGGVEGVLIGLKPRAFTNLQSAEQGIVLELEHRRKSGRGVRDWFFLPNSPSSKASGVQPLRETVTLLDDHSLFRRPKEESAGAENELAGMTFELGLTERQRLEREGVVLPYFDAQKAGGGAGEGGRILYDMGVEDDFDEEEDEI
jgi:elongator complex protein 5